MKKISIMLVIVMLLSSMLVLGACGEKKGANDFVYFLYTGNTKYDTNYKQNAFVQYLLSREWAGSKLSMEIQIPSKSSSASETVSTMISTGDYPDIFDGHALNSWTLDELYEEEVIMDITPYVEQYMPNYMAYLKDNPDVAPVATRTINGEKKYLALYVLDDIATTNCWTYCYRRDWILQYGKNPSTGESFTGGYDAEGNWNDNIIFPNGTNVPIYISDWEWMFDIFEIARADLGLTEDTDSYCISISYLGSDYVSGLSGAFNSYPGFYQDNDGEIRYGITDENSKVYFDTMHKWYEKGWLDKAFFERSSDKQWEINLSSVSAGKVGMWFGQIAYLGNTMSENVEGAYVMAARPPMNDMYAKGTSACYDAETNAFHNNFLYAFSKVNGFICISTAAKDKNLEALFSMLDHTYTEEATIIRDFGLTAAQQQELQNPFYIEHGITNAWVPAVNLEGEPVYRDDGRQMIMFNNELLTNEYKRGASAGERLFGRSIRSLYYIPKDKWLQLSYDEMMHFEQGGYIQTEITNQLSPEVTVLYGDMNSYMQTALQEICYKYVTGELDAYNAADWALIQEKLDVVYKNGKTYQQISGEILTALNAIVNP